jgi:hypothetical protein
VAPININAQNIMIYFNDGEVSVQPLSEIRKIAFGENNMLLQKNDGSQISLPITDIEKITYTDINTGILKKKGEKLDVKVYPNPSGGNFKIDFYLSENKNMDVSIFSIDGRLIENIQSGEMTKGMHSIFWQNVPLPGGSYLIRIKNDNQLTYKKIIIIN